MPPSTGHIGEPARKRSGTGTSPVLYQPASRFWAFQSIEAGIFVALTLIVLGATVWLVHRRAA